MPETFSESFCCLVCGLVHKPGAGLDAFRLSETGEIEARIEIKATITESGFTDVKRDLLFDELYWLSFSSYNSLAFEVYRIQKQDIEHTVKASQTKRDRGTVSLAKIVERSGLTPVRKGYVGVVSTVI